MPELKACPHCKGEIILRLGKPAPECVACGRPVIDPKAAPVLILGLDLGQTTDPTALAALQQTRRPDPARPERLLTHYDVIGLERFPLGTSYPSIVEALAKRTGDEPLRGCTLAVDQTGVGRPVVDMIRRASLPVVLRPITITAGHSVTEDAQDLSFHVPKKDLVGVLQVLMQAGRVHISPKLALARTLKQELTDFQVKVSAAANELFGTWREGKHDDVCFAVMLAAWIGERCCVGVPEIGMPKEGKGGAIASLPRGVFGRTLGRLFGGD